MIKGGNGNLYLYCNAFLKRFSKAIGVDFDRLGGGLGIYPFL